LALLFTQVYSPNRQKYVFFDNEQEYLALPAETDTLKTLQKMVVTAMQTNSPEA
jgi:hypothetical protein